MVDYFNDFSRNMVLWTAISSWFIAQSIKFAIEFFKNRRISFYILLLSTGGMPSSHSSFVMAMTTAIGFKEGFGSSFFAISAAVSMITMADAAGIRRAAGNQAKVLNMLIERLNNPAISVDQKLRELLGHSPIEVGAGAILGVVIGVISSAIYGLF